MRLKGVRNDLHHVAPEALTQAVASYLDVHYCGAEPANVVRECCYELADYAAGALEPEAFDRLDVADAACPLPPCAKASCVPSMPAAPMAPIVPGAPVRSAAAAPGGAPRDLDALLRNLDASFSQTLLQLIDERGFSDAQVYKRANISRQHFAKMRKDPAYRPTKQTALALGVALELELDELATLLERAGFALSHAS